MALNLMTPSDVSHQIAALAKIRRLSLNLTQKTLAERSGVSLAVIKKFEGTGKIALLSLLKLALVFNALDDFKAVFAEPTPGPIMTLKRLLAYEESKKRQRGRK